MNATLLAQKAYGPSEAAPVRTGRSTEFMLFSQTTARLRQAANDSANFRGLAEALHENRRVWTHLAIEVADGANQLPAKLRAQVFYLAEFTVHHTRQVLRGEADVEALIDINTAVMRGLSGQANTPEAE
ncbi:MAG: flagellar biosynthesis regulator FlaF [Rhodobacteraceae bacterium]|nr:flagellar biosynthesis regulator FlaF [Paracoccaceae bacterium]